MWLLHKSPKCISLSPCHILDFLHPSFTVWLSGQDSASVIAGNIYCLHFLPQGLSFSSK